MALPLPPPSVPLPAQPNDPDVALPAAPVFPPTVNDVLGAVNYRRDVTMSVESRSPAVRCTSQDQCNSILYEHNVVAQAAAAAGPQAAPPGFQAAIQQLRNDIRSETVPDLKKLMNQGRGDGAVVQYEVVPFNNGRDPTLPPYNLPPLLSVNTIENLNGHDLGEYLTRYGIVPLPVAGNPHATNRLRKETLKRLVGASA